MATTKGIKRKHPAKPGGTTRVHDVDVKELRAVLERARTQVMSAEDYALVTGAVDTFTALTRELQLKGATLERLRRLFLGASSEKRSKVLKGESNDGADAGPKPAGPEKPNAPAVGNRPKGHGRNGAAAYTGAKREHVPHASLHGGDRCPGCATGKVYGMKVPAVLVRIQGVAPLGATIWECDRLRCNGCGEVFTASAPAGVGTETYDESAGAMVAILRYGVGLPHNRIERLQHGLGIPMPASTQWGLVDRHFEALAPVHDALVAHAAQGEVLHNDDTHMKVLELCNQTREEALAAGASDPAADRSGVRTTGIVSRVGDHKVALFFTGRQIAGEGLETVLEERLARLPPPIHMSDGLLSHNLPPVLQTIVATCLVHARRYFVDIVENFPAESQKVIDVLAEVYKNDATARNEKMTPQQRLEFHKQHSGPPMVELKTWLQTQLDKREVESNSPLGAALRYMIKHWSTLTLFLRQAGAPLDNNICERALKKAILHRKNSMFYRTVHGALVGDLYMALIHTAELNHVEPFRYLVALMRHPREVAGKPSDWLPWNYETAQARLAPTATP